MNKLQSITKLHNRYFVLRHGRSKANDEELIVSHPDEGTSGYGLTEAGKEQVRTSVTHAKEKGVLDATTLIYSSDFVRAKETAEIAKEVLGSKEVVLTSKLRERYFGSWDKTHNAHYQDVWNDDEKNPHHKIQNVESTTEVLERTTSLIEEIENQYSGRNVLLVSHGDALQILQTAFEQVSSAHHRNLPHLNTAEIREFSLR